MLQPLKTEGSERCCSGTQPHVLTGYLTEDVGTELTQNSRTSLLLHKGLKPTVQRTVLFISYLYKTG